MTAKSESRYFVTPGIMRTVYWVHKSHGWANVTEAELHNSLLRPEIYTWMKNEIGERNENWDWDLRLDYFYFKNEEDKVKFILRWL